MNPDKTEHLLYTDEINCTNDPHEAYVQMKMVYEQYTGHSFDEPKPKVGNGRVKAIHYIMSFADEENVTPELAQKIAHDFVRRAFGEDVQAVLAVHVDKEHVHCHCIINTYSMSGRKYNANKATLRHVRETANTTCRTYRIRPVLNFGNEGKSISHYEWEQKKNKTSWKQQIRVAIDELISSVQNLNELLSILEERGYEIKRGKYISIRAPGQQRAIRTQTLGEEYAKEYLNARILYRDVGTGEVPPPDKRSKLWEAYASIIGDVRILAEQSRKVPRKQNMILPYSADNDLDIFRMSAQLAVISKLRIISTGDLEGRIRQLKWEMDVQRGSLNEQLGQLQNCESLMKQADTYNALRNRDDLSEPEQTQLSVCRQAMYDNSILYKADYDHLRNRIESLKKHVDTLKESYEKSQKELDVYVDLANTFYEISNGDYLAKLEEEERQRKEKLQEKKKKLKR